MAREIITKSYRSNNGTPFETLEEALAYEKERPEAAIVGLSVQEIADALAGRASDIADALEAVGNRCADNRRAAGNYKRARRAPGAGEAAEAGAEGGEAADGERGA